MLAVTTPFPQYQDIGGDPLDAGSLYYGTVNLDPVQNPVDVFWDAGGTIPAAQPIRTVNGLPARNGTPALLYCATSYSLTVLNKAGRQVFYAPDSAAFSIADAFNAFTNDFSGPNGAAQMSYIQLGDGAVIRTVLDGLRDSMSVEEFGATGNGTADDAAAFQKAIAESLIQNGRPVRGPRVYALSGPVDISNFAQSFQLEVNRLVTHATFPAVPTLTAFGQTFSDWKNGTPMLRIGNVGGSQVGLDIRVNSVDGGGKADTLLVTKNGAGGSKFHLGRVQNANIISKHAGNLSPTASNMITGGYWQDSVMAGYTVGAGGVCEGTMFDVGFITSCKYGGLYFGNRTQYANVRGQLDFSGQWLTEVAVNNLAGFAVGDYLTNASGSYAELLAAYTHQGQQYMLVIETSSTLAGATHFAVGNNLTNPQGSLATITGLSTANQSGNARYFDIISALDTSQPFFRALVMCPYLGGIVGSNLWNCTVDYGNSGTSYSSWFAGMEVYNSGTTLSLADKRSSDQSFADITDNYVAFNRPSLYLGNNSIRGPNATQIIPNGTTVAFLTLPAGAAVTGSVWDVVAVNPNDGGQRCKGTVYVAAGSTAGVLVVDSAVGCTLSIASNVLSINQGSGADKPMTMTILRRG